MQSHQCSGHGAPLYSVHQSLDELEFERGVWGSAMDGNIEKLTKLLKDVDPSIPDSSGYTALHYAARNRQEESCKLLLEKRANPNAQTPGGATPLHRAAFIGNVNIVSLLLRYKADATIQDSDGKTALHKIPLFLNERDREDDQGGNVSDHTIVLSSDTDYSPSFLLMAQGPSKAILRQAQGC